MALLRGRGDWYRHAYGGTKIKGRVTIDYRSGTADRLLLIKSTALF